MMNTVWLVLITAGILVSAFSGNPEKITATALSSSREAISLALGLAGAISLWSGLSKIAERSGLMDIVSRGARPLIAPLFPAVPRDSPALSAIAMSMSANILGLGAAATPLGLKAIKELKAISKDGDTASDSMCTFLVITSSSLTLAPSTIISLRAELGSASPGMIVGTILVATTCSTAMAISLDMAFRKLGQYRTRRRRRRR